MYVPGGSSEVEARPPNDREPTVPCTWALIISDTENTSLETQKLVEKLNLWSGSIKISSPKLLWA